MATQKAKPRLLLLTRNLPPLIGGMERLIWHIADELKISFDLHVVGPTGAAELAPAGVGVTEIPFRSLWLFLLRMKMAVFLQTLKLRPQIVFAGSGLTAPFAWLGARIVGARAIVYLHGLDIDTQHRIYRLLWLPFIRRCDHVLANSHHTRQLAINAGVAENRLTTLHPGVDLPDLSDSEASRYRFRERYNLGNAPVMLYVGRITARKGLLPFVEEILPKVCREIPDARLVVIGDEPNLALLKGESLLNRIHHALHSNRLTENVIFLGSRAHDDPEINEAYFAADTHVFPVQERPGDNEGFGMVAIEAAAHGLPTVAFSAGGVADSVCNALSGQVVAAGDNDSFTNSLIEFLTQSRQKPNSSCVEFAQQFSWPEFGRHLLEICARA
ncbi:glycosyltransferase family 4 protein [Thiohalobacter thiocyanaticus]|uniref:Glycosyltransferase family 1 protein n=1 Tax=Thiohalobacter thiocyanaticus TaxID=585455 RepID=A0A426QLA3_9GAMM|nr:glycosyltransferase family 4 protein [Thiohalobacter thiocyanaticus]RRQ22530.1 glycosyltransferase family 1 protein [Thiohalobacter thiocyanaticus]